MSRMKQLYDDLEDVINKWQNVTVGSMVVLEAKDLRTIATALRVLLEAEFGTENTQKLPNTMTISVPSGGWDTYEVTW